MQGKLTTDCDGLVEHEKWQEPAGTLLMALTAYKFVPLFCVISLFVLAAKVFVAQFFRSLFVSCHKTVRRWCLKLSRQTRFTLNSRISREPQDTFSGLNEEASLSSVQWVNCGNLPPRKISRSLKREIQPAHDSPSCLASSTKNPKKRSSALGDCRCDVCFHFVLAVNHKKIDAKSPALIWKTPQNRHSLIFLPFYTCGCQGKVTIAAKL